MYPPRDLNPQKVNFKFTVSTNSTRRSEPARLELTSLVLKTKILPLNYSSSTLLITLINISPTVKYVYKYYLSISPKTKSKVPITVTRSANNKLFASLFKTCKCKKPVDLILTLDGLLLLEVSI